MRQAMMSQEHVLYCDRSVYVSSMRLVVTKGGSYPIATISQITSGQVTSKRPWIRFLVFGSSFLAMGALLNQLPILMKYNLLLNGELFLSIGAGLFLFGIFNISFNVLPLYAVEIHGSFGMRRPIERRNKRAVLQIVAALGEAMSMRDTPTEIIMGDKVQGDKVHGNSYKIGDIIGSTGIAIGAHNTISTNSTNTPVSTELIEALKMLASTIGASKCLPDQQKHEQIEIVTQIQNEAAKPNPNMSMLKALASELVATLKVVPDVVQAVNAVIPMFSKFHL